jgi:type II secretory pathway component PulJ
MNNKRNKVRKIGGFTVVEMLVATLLSTIVVTAALKVYLVQQKHLVIQDQISDMQQSVRSCVDELSTKIRMAGYNLPTGVTPLFASNSNPDTITIVYDDGSLENVQIEHAMPQPSSELRCDGHDLSSLHDGDWLYIFDPNTNTGEYFLTSHIQYASSNIQHNTMSLSKTYPVGSKILKMSVMKYYIDHSTDASHPRLMSKYMNQAAQIYADNISDLQFQYVLSSGVTVDTPPVATMVREVIIGITSRTDKSDTEFATNYRTRNLQTRVKVRNLVIH